MGRASVKRAGRLFLDFFKLGCFTFGGGWSIVAQMQKKYVEGEGRLTSEELLDITSVGRSLPGTMIGNVAFMFGYREGGALCGAACVIGMILPPMIILTIITCFYSLVINQPWVMKAMIGVRAAVVPIIANAAWKLKDAAFTYKICYLLTAVGCCLYVFWNVSCILLVVLGIIAGIFISEIQERREAVKHGTP